MPKKTIYKYDLDIYKRPTKWSHNKDKFTIEKVDIIAENKLYIVLDDLVFSKLSKERDSICYPKPEKPLIRFKDVLNEQGIFYLLYSYKKKRVETIEKEIRAEAEKKFGWLSGDNLDLSILHKGK